MLCLNVNLYKLKLANYLQFWLRTTKKSNSFRQTLTGKNGKENLGYWWR
jgi:hypothetical protein